MMRIPWQFSQARLHISVHTMAKPTHRSKVALAFGCLILAYRHCIIGQTLYTKGDSASLAIMDKQIYRLIGKATTLAA
jgi:hypothetical protein